MRRYETALKWFTQAIEIKKDYKETYYNRAQTYLNLGSLKFAFEDLKTIISLDSTFVKSFYLRGLIYLGLEDTLNACRDFQKTLNKGFPWS